MGGFGGLLHALRNIPLVYERFVDPAFAGSFGKIARLLAIDAVAGKRQDLEPLHRNLLATARTNPIAALLQAVEGEIDRLEPLLDLFDQAGMGLDLGQGARYVHFITGRSYSFLFLVAPVIPHPR